MFQGKVICDNCHTSNDSKSVRCTKCGSILDETIMAVDSFREKLVQRVAEIQDLRASQEMAASLVEASEPMTGSDMSGDAILIEQNHSKEFHIKKGIIDPIKVGRFPHEDATHINLAGVSGRSSGVSRLHASFNWHGDTLQLIDNDSRNGTYVNGEKLSPGEATALKDNDVISFGFVSFLLTFQ